jgi:hypothetical protein
MIIDSFSTVTVLQVFQIQDDLDLRQIVRIIYAPYSIENSMI